ncbi:FdrA family protein [Spelaeicoccus albus]|uniref:FdrA protein n=1 Tax=Spelaeicoccus albus TaxID=1280376 RepID=A0A7Z0D456_9MICO|nr:FdrA family protein [Spelaeicoccus albus]NYI68547.1 FdrA protein [Spelaeicoccus albus]
MGTTHVEVRTGTYHDSVTLLRISKDIAALPGIRAAQVAMGTPLNVDVLAGMGFDVPRVGPDDLVIALESEDAGDPGAGAPGDTGFDEALGAVADRLARRGSATTEDKRQPPRTVGAAIADSDAPLALVSVPGSGAAAEAWDALERGISVMLFSDNVEVADEIALKDAARDKGLLVLGPDCGTALIGGVGLGFANAVRPGEISLVAASGTGAQQLMTLLDAAGIGVRHCLGVGGRDLGADVRGRGVLASVDALSRDEGTRHTVIVSKPADAAVVDEVDAHARRLGLPVTWAVLGPGHPDLTETAETICRETGVEPPAWPRWNPAGESAPSRSGALLRGLYAGGTLCGETATLASERLGSIDSGAAASGPGALRTALASGGHAVIDLGDDALTIGRAHPMIDPELRLEMFDDAVRDPRVGVVLMDVVLGYGAAADPAGDYCDAIARALADRSDLSVIVSLIGTAHDPQGFAGQAERFAAAGAHVYASNAEAARAAVSSVA